MQVAADKWNSNLKIFLLSDKNLQLFQIICFDNIKNWKK